MPVLGHSHKFPRAYNSIWGSIILKFWLQNMYFICFSVFLILGFPRSGFLAISDMKSYSLQHSSFQSLKLRQGNRAHFPHIFIQAHRGNRITVVPHVVDQTGYKPFTSFHSPHRPLQPLRSCGRRRERHPEWDGARRQQQPTCCRR